MAWSDSTNLISALTDGTGGGTVSVHDAATGDEIASVTPGHGRVAGLAWSGDGDPLAITSEGGPAIIWDVTTGTTRAEIPPEAAGHHFPSFGANDGLLAVSDLPRDPGPVARRRRRNGRARRVRTGRMRAGRSR